MPKCRPAFVHHLSLPLRIEILGNFADDSNDFPLPGFQQRGVFFKEIEAIETTIMAYATSLAAAPPSIKPNLEKILLPKTSRSIRLQIN